jgi:hypothetical protein
VTGANKNHWAGQPVKDIISIRHYFIPPLQPEFISFALENNVTVK